jgi:hypothetical protein
MAKITSKSGLNVGTELTIDTAARTITLLVAGNLVAKDGVSWQALYSKFVQLWTDADYNEFPFPFYALDVLSGQYLMGTDGATYNGWKFANDDSRGYMRDGGWVEYNASGAVGRVYTAIISLGAVTAGSQLYYQTTSSGAATNFLYDDAANQGVQVYGNATADATTTTFDNQTFFKGFVREEQKKYKDSVLADTGKSGTGAFIVNVLLSNETDLDVVVADAGIGASPFSEVNIKYFPTAFQKDVDTPGTPRSFGIVVDVGTHSAVDGVTNGTALITTAAAGIVGADYVGGTVTVHSGAGKGTYLISGTPTATNVVTTTVIAGSETGLSFTLQRAAPVSASLQQIYTKVQYLLRQSGNINGLASAGSVAGKTASLVANFVGPVLNTGFFAPSNLNGGGTGVTVQGYAPADVNSFVSYDNSSVARSYPFASAGVLSFNANLTAGGAGYYRMYITDSEVGADDFGTANAITVNDVLGNPIAGTISSGSIPFDFDFTSNAQGGRTGSTSLNVTVIAGNPGVGKPVVSTGVLTASKSISIALVAETDRSYV